MIVGLSPKSGMRRSLEQANRTRLRKERLLESSRNIIHRAGLSLRDEKGAIKGWESPTEAPAVGNLNFVRVSSCRGRTGEYVRLNPELVERGRNLEASTIEN